MPEEGLLIGIGFWEGNANVLELNSGIDAQFCEYSKKKKSPLNCILKRVNFDT